MTARTKNLIDTAVKVIGAVFAIGGVVGGGFAIFYGLETSTHASAERGKLSVDIQARETKEHAQEQHDQIRQALTQALESQTRVNAEILDELKIQRQRTWEILQDTRRRNGGRHEPR